MVAKAQAETCPRFALVGGFFAARRVFRHQLLMHGVGKLHEFLDR